MSLTIKTYALSSLAENDLIDIFDYTDREFGFDQAAIYLTNLEGRLFELVNNPKLGRERNDIRPGLRSLNSANHIIFYRILSDHIRIVRVLHGSRDFPKLL